MEEAIRKIDKKLSLPYWDSTLDFDMENPANTIMFAPEFLGDGYGLVTTGPFANWATPIGKLERNIGGDNYQIDHEADSDIELYHDLTQPPTTLYFSSTTLKQLDVGPTFRAPPAEPRTQKAQLARMR
ncbi:hypothetical protein DPMN_169754 [Dreissena polymorpha]|uniref:Tyrosinase copper-binding domain-containing protein n=1 Tax=Dreissena polymorpha TaxID=45954 RepID=A0A9D4DYA8_DREPO|nr:hypothetical protein DPMN_169754 [Dreissena polymorpha]